MSSHDDAFHEMWLQQDCFMRLLQKERGFPEFPVDLSSKNGQQIIDGIVLHMVKEAFEALQHLKNAKPHRVTEVKEFDREAYLEEMVDVLHLYFEACIASGITPDALFAAYMEKGTKNTKRIKEGY